MRAATPPRPAPRAPRSSAALSAARLDGALGAFAGLLAAWLVAGPWAAGAVVVEREAAGVERQVGVAAVGVGQVDGGGGRVPLPCGDGAQPAPQRRRGELGGGGEPVDLEEALSGVEHEPVAGPALEPVGPGGEDRRLVA